MLLAKRDERHLFLGVSFLGVAHTGIDLYFAAGEEPARKLHVSSALGESEYLNNAWSDMVWGENTRWTANSIGSVYREGRTEYLAPHGFEFQIRTSELSASQWRVLIHLKRPELVLPAGADPSRPDQWLVLRP